MDPIPDSPLRFDVYRSIVATGRVPSIRDIVTLRRESAASRPLALHRLSDIHALVLDADGEIAMAHPFSATPTGYAVDTGQVTFFANCAWDAARDSRDAEPLPPSVAARCACQCAEPIPLEFDNGALAPVETASCTSPCLHAASTTTSGSPEPRFSPSGRKGTWTAGARAPGIAKGPSLPIGQCALLGRLWYADRLTPAWRPKDAATIERILGEAGIGGDFWSIRRSVDAVARRVGYNRQHPTESRATSICRRSHAKLAFVCLIVAGAVSLHRRSAEHAATGAAGRRNRHVPRLHGRPDVLSGGVRMIPITTPKGTFNVWTKRVGNNPRIKVLLLHGGPGVDARVLRGVRQLLSGRGHRVLLLRPARLVLQRPARDAGRLLGAAALRRRSRAGAAGARPRPGQLLPARPVVGRHPRHRVRAQVPAAPEGPHHLEHDGEHPAVQRVRRRRC